MKTKGILLCLTFAIGALLTAGCENGKKEKLKDSTTVMESVRDSAAATTDSIKSNKRDSLKTQKKDSLATQLADTTAKAKADTTRNRTHGAEQQTMTDSAKIAQLNDSLHVAIDSIGALNQTNNRLEQQLNDWTPRLLFGGGGLLAGILLTLGGVAIGRRLCRKDGRKPNVMVKKATGKHFDNRFLQQIIISKDTER